MKLPYLICKVLIAIWSSVAITLAYAGTPLWTFTPLTATSLVVPATGTASVKYTLTNQSRKTHTLMMRSIPGITQVTTPGNCPNPIVLEYHQSCILNLTIAGSALQGSVSGGPVVCQVSSFSQCNQPSAANSLQIVKEGAEFTVGGSVFGLQGTLVLQNNGADTVTLNTDGTFVFPESFSPGSTYAVTIQSQPTTQTCTVSNGNGVINNANVTNIIVNCSTNTRTIGGTVSGLSGTVVLQNNGSDSLSISSDGPFTFPTPLAQGATYNVTVLTQPATQTCTINNGSGSVGETNVTNVQVICATNAFTVGGIVSGLSGTVILQNNSSDHLSLSSNGSFTFPTPVAQGAPYSVTVFTQPAGQNCTVGNGSGTMGGANVTNVTVNCVNTVILNTSVTDLGLSVNNTALNPALTGTPRIITITNTGIISATNLTVTLPTWPSGTTSSTTCGTTLGAGNSCTVTITPGSSATSDGTNPCSTGTAPVPGVVQVTADNTAGVSINAVILSYGCIYQGGYLFSVDDTTANTGSIGGKVAATANQVTTLPWEIGNSDTSADSITDGVANTNTLATPVGRYPAAQACLNKVDQGFSNWYLPALCEMGYDASGGGSGCGTQVSPLLQNLYSNLKENSIGGFGTFVFWSSTEDSLSPTLLAWSQSFLDGSQPTTSKNLARRVRCVRIF